MNLNDKRFSAYSSMSGKKTENEKKSVSGAGNVSSSAGTSGSANVPGARKVSAAEESRIQQLLFKVPAADSEPGKESVYRRVAKFLIILGTDQAARVLQHLPEEQTEKIVAELASIRSVKEEEKEVILAEFEGLAAHTFEEGGKETARTILEKAWGPEKAKEMLSRAAPYVGAKPFDYLNREESEKVLLLLNDESVPVQALVLSHLEPKKAADIINKMAEEAKTNVVLQLANMGAVSPEVIRRVDQAMHEKSESVKIEKADRIDGRSALSEILKKMSPGSEEGILRSLSREDPELGRDLKDRLFTVEDVLLVDDRAIQEYLRDLENTEVVYLIAGKGGEYRKKLLGCVSASRRKLILEEEDLRKPILRSACDEATAKFISVLREAYERGRLVIKGRNDEEFV